MSMNEVIICFQSAAQAIMAEQALVEKSIDVRIMPLPASIQAGCGFCLRFLPEDAAKAAAFLSGRGLELGGAYERESSSGSYRRVAL